MPSCSAEAVHDWVPTVTVMSPRPWSLIQGSAWLTVMPPTGTPATLTPGANTPAGSGDASSLDAACATPSGTPKASTAATARRRRDQSTWAVLHFSPERADDNANELGALPRAEPAD